MQMTKKENSKDTTQLNKSYNKSYKDFGLIKPSKPSKKPSSPPPASKPAEEEKKSADK